MAKKRIRIQTPSFSGLFVDLKIGKLFETDNKKETRKTAHSEYSTFAETGGYVINNGKDVYNDVSKLGTTYPMFIYDRYEQPRETTFTVSFNTLMTYTVDGKATPSKTFFLELQASKKLWSSETELDDTVSLAIKADVSFGFFEEILVSNTISSGLTARYGNNELHVAPIYGCLNKSHCGTGIAGYINLTF